MKLSLFYDVGYHFCCCDVLALVWLKNDILCRFRAGPYLALINSFFRPAYVLSDHTI